MASIKKRRNKFNVVYYYITETGERKQKWEPYDTEAEAKKRKAEVEYKQKVNRFIAPSKLTVSEFLDNFVELYGEKKWDTKPCGGCFSCSRLFLRQFHAAMRHLCAGAGCSGWHFGM